MTAPDTSKIWGMSKDVLTIAVVPLVAWVINIEVGNAQRDVKIQQVTASAARVQELDHRVQLQAVQMARMEEKLDAANRRLDGIHDEIRNIVRGSKPQ